MRIKTIVLALLVSTFFCLSCDNESVDPNAREIVFFNGKIYTVNSSQLWVDAIYIKDGVIKYVGTNEEAKNMASSEAVLVDLKGDFMMPGIHDVHMHPLEASTDNFHFVVNSNITNPENYIGTVASANGSNTGSGWLLGWGHYLETVLSATRPPREILDEAVSDRPVAIMEQTSHSVWCNSKALEMMNITASTPNPIGGIIMKDANGEPNGILIDNAGNMLLDVALAPTAASEEKDYNGLINFGLPELAKNGITSICDARTYWKHNHHDTWKRIANEEKLTCRVNLGLWAYPSENDVTQIAMLQSLYENNSNSFLKINQIKLYSDGIVHNTTCAMHADFLVNYFGGATNNGLNYFTEQRIGNYIAALESIGFDFHIHAIGNRGVHESLNAIENHGTSVGRHRLTHIEFVDASDYNRFATLNVTADAQVAGDFTKPENWDDNDYLVGAALADNIIPLKSLKNANARITLSSDWDVSDVNPFVGLENAVKRSPQELTLEEAVKAYTINAAYVMRQEDKVGSIAVGKEADLIILDRNIFEIASNQISKTKVKATYLKGKRVYQR